MTLGNLLYCSAFFLVEKKLITLDKSAIEPFNDNWEERRELELLTGVELDENWYLFIIHKIETHQGQFDNYIYDLFQKIKLPAQDCYFIIFDSHLPLDRIIEIKNSWVEYDIIVGDSYFEAKGYVSPYLLGQMQKEGLFGIVFSFLKEKLGINMGETPKEMDTFWQTLDQLFCIPFQKWQGQYAINTRNMISYKEEQLNAMREAMIGQQNNLSIDYSDIVGDLNDLPF